MKTEDLKNTQEYKYGFTTELESIRAPKGLNKETIKFISKIYPPAAPLELLTNLLLFNFRKICSK